jgi:hypothetical protein
MSQLHAQATHTAVARPRDASHSAGEVVGAGGNDGTSHVVDGDDACGIDRDVLKEAARR